MTPRFEQAILRFNSMNSEDLRMSDVNGRQVPTQLLEAERLERWVLRLAPEANEALRLAARCQHLKRFSFPRSEYPEGRNGYLQWRKDLMKKHAELASQVLKELAYDASIIEQVRAINTKQELKLSFNSQTMEDALCLSFLEHEFSDFSEKYEDEKVIAIVQKTWRKMSEEGHHFALQLPFVGRAQALVQRALS